MPKEMPRTIPAGDRDPELVSKWNKLILETEAWAEEALRNMEKDVIEYEKEKAKQRQLAEKARKRN